MEKRARKQTLVVALLTVIVSFTLICACGSRLGKVAHRLGVGGETSMATSPTPMPPWPTEPFPLLPGGPLNIPAEPDTPFQVDLTQDQINEYLAGQTYNLKGVEVSDAHVNITDQAIIADLTAREQQTGMTLPLTVRGVPVASDGNLYFRVESFELGSSVGGLGRVIAKGLIQRALDQYSTDTGIPVPISNIQVDSVQLEPNRIIATGETK